MLRETFSFEPFHLQEAEDEIRTCFTIVTPKEVPVVFPNDPPDDQVVAIIQEAKIDTIISGDKGVLAQKEYKGVPIMSVEQFLTEYHLVDNNDF